MYAIRSYYEHTTGFNEGQAVSVLPLETAETINDSWGFRLTDRNYKSTRDLIRYLVRAAGHNANFLLNVGPMPNGEIQPEFEERLRITSYNVCYTKLLRSRDGVPSRRGR